MSSQHLHVHDPRQWNQAVLASFERLSPLYHQFYLGMQQDPSMLALLSLVDRDQPMYVLFFSMVNVLALREPSHPFAEFYPYFCARPRPAAEAYPVFRAFCLSQARELRTLLPWARLQTNEVSRCANLLPAFELVSRRAGRQPLALIEVGASAGLNLLWDHYGYRYGNLLVGDPRSPVQIRCTLKGPNLPPFPAVMPLIAQRVGIDLASIDLSQPRAADWLLACIWPEEVERYRVLMAAIKMAQEHPPRLVAGDACELLPDMLVSMPADTAICVWHSYALSQGPTVVYERVVQHLLDASRTRDIFHLSLELDPARGPQPRLELWVYREGKVACYDWLASCEVHGEGMTWHGFSAVGSSSQPQHRSLSDPDTRNARDERTAS